MTTAEQVSVAVVPSRSRRWATLDSSLLLWIVLIVVLLLLVANPVLRLFWSSLETPASGSLTLDNYVRVFSDPRNIEAIWNSIVYAFLTGILAAALGVPLAWLATRSDIPFKGAIRLMVLASFIMPSYLASVAWILLAGPNAGWINQTFKWLTGADFSIVNVYSLPGLVFVTALHSFAYMFVFTSSALSLVNSEMEDAANILGAGRMKTTIRITLPLVLPAITGGFIVVFLETLALFGVPAMLATPANYHVMTSELYYFFQRPGGVHLASAFAIPLLLITVVLFAAQRLLLDRKGYASLTGKGGEKRLIPLGKWKWPVACLVGLVGVVTILMPFLILLRAAFARSWGRPMSFDNFTLTHFRFVLFDSALIQASIVNSVLVAAAAAVLATVLSLFIAYIVSRKLVPFAGVLAFFAMAPFVIPGIVLAIGFFAAYAGPPWYLYGTIAIIVLAFAARFMPIGYANSNAAMKSIHPELEEAVRILGGTRLTAIRRVVVPLLRGSLVGAIILVFIPAVRELSAAIFLYSARTPLISVQLYMFTDEGLFEPLAALGIIMLLITTALVALGFRLVGRDFLQRGSS